MKEEIDILKQERVRLRKEWNDLRDLKLARKHYLLAGGVDMCNVRHDKEYRKYRKLQRTVSGKIKHLEIKINRSISRNS